MLPAVRTTALAIAFLVVAGIADAQSDPSLRVPAHPQGAGRLGGAQAPPPFAFQAPPPATVKDGFTYAVLGDISQVGPVAQPPAPEFERVLRIVRAADFALANQEGTAFDYKSRPWISGSGMFPMDSGSPRDIRAMGVDMLSLANNHGGDYGPEALVENMRLLEAAGMKHVGAGHDLREARGASRFDTPRGRVTVVATAGTFKEGFSAVDYRRGHSAARPGISTVRTTITQRVTAPEMRLLQQLRGMRRDGTAADGDTALPRQLTVLGQTYQLGDTPGLSFRMDPADLREITHAVHVAKQSSDFTVFTIHAHQSATGTDDTNPEPADYLVQLFHAVVDAGADVVAGHGNHHIRGIEIYKGKPIFYGLGSFSFSGRSGGISGASAEAQRTAAAPPPAPAQPESRAPVSTAPARPVQPRNEYLRPLPGGGDPMTMWENMFAMTEWEGGKLKEIRIYPLDLNAAGDKRKGVPSLASGPMAARILGEVRRISAPFGTYVQIEGEVGIIRP